MKPVIDPRRGDIEDDASSTKRRSLLSLAGTLLAEISLPKLALAWILLLVVPSLILGLSPLIASAWIAKVTGKIVTPFAGIWPAAVLVIAIALAWFAGGPLLRLVENSFWSLNSIAVEPGYAACREALQYLVERLLLPRVGKARRATLRAATTAAAGLVVCGLSLLLIMLVWPSTRWVGEVSDLVSVHRLAPVALANGVVLVAAYVAAAALVWAFADATMAQPSALVEFQSFPDEATTWRIAHLSDIHVVGERYGFKIESGRSGPQGNERLKRVLVELDALHTKNPLHAILITGDITDAGRSVEWAEFLDAPSRSTRAWSSACWCFRAITTSMSSTAPIRRLGGTPTSPARRLRQIRALSAMASMQGQRVRIVDHSKVCLGKSLAEAVEKHRVEMEKFADAGGIRLSKALNDLSVKAFPMILPPDRDGGLGLVLLELERRYALFLYERARHGLGRAGPRHRDRRGTIPASALDHRPPSPPRRIPLGGECPFRAYSSPHQWQLDRPPTATAGGSSGPHARSSTHRLDRQVCRACHRIGALSGHGGDRRYAHIFTSIPWHRAQTGLSGCLRRSGSPSRAKLVSETN